MLLKNYGVIKKMISGTAFEQGEIVLVPFPFSDLSISKQRPVLIISKNVYNQNSEDIITCGITSYLKNAPCSVLIDNKNLINGSIPKKSRIKVDKLFTIKKDLVRRKIAQINKQTFDQVKCEFLKLIN